jgi:hypothetical protein
MYDARRDSTSLVAVKPFGIAETLAPLGFHAGAGVP